MDTSEVIYYLTAMVITLNDVVAESNTDIFGAYPDLTFRERNDCIQRAVQYTLKWTQKVGHNTYCLYAKKNMS